MAQIEVDSGTNPDAVAMAQAIIDAQNIEIETMREILQAFSSPFGVGDVASSNARTEPFCPRLPLCSSW